MTLDQLHATVKFLLRTCHGAYSLGVKEQLGVYDVHHLLRGADNVGNKDLRQTQDNRARHVGVCVLAREDLLLERRYRCSQRPRSIFSFPYIPLCQPAV